MAAGHHGLPGARLRTQRGAGRRDRCAAHGGHVHRGQHRAQHHLHPARRRRAQRRLRAAAGAGDEGPRRRRGLYRPAADARRVGAAGHHRRRHRSSPRCSWRSTRATTTPAQMFASRRRSRSGVCRRSSSTASTRLLGQVLNARGSFGPMMWAPVVNNIVAIVGALSFIALYTVAPDDPSSLPTGGIALLGRHRHARCRAAGAGTHPRAAAHRASATARASTSAASGWAGRGDLAKWTLLFVLVNQLAYVGHRQPGHARRQAASRVRATARGSSPTAAPT